MIRFFAKHPTAANLLMLTLLILGISSLSTIKRETFPEFDPPYILAGVVYWRFPARSRREYLCPNGRCC